jgi:hypothetical protein
MKYQEPAEGVLKTGMFGEDAMFYRIACDCGNEDDAHYISIEADGDIIQVHIDHTQHTKWWELSRWKQIWQIMTKGYAETQTTLVLNEQAAYNYGETLKRAVVDVKKFRDERLKK